jgi:hypothetical protein
MYYNYESMKNKLVDNIIPTCHLQLWKEILANVQKFRMCIERWINLLSQEHFWREILSS